MTRLITLIATLALAAAVLFSSPSDYRMALCITVSVAATTVALRSLFSGKLVGAVLFVGVLGIFTPFLLSPFSHVLRSILDMATLALFAASPLMLRKSTMTVATSTPQGNGVTARRFIN